MQPSIRIAVSAVVCWLFATRLFSAEIIPLSTQNQIHSIQGNKTTLSQSIGSALSLDPSESIALLTQSNDKTGATHYRFQQMYHAIPIYGYHILVTEDKTQQTTRFSGSKVSGIAEDITFDIANAQTIDALPLMKQFFLASNTIEKNGSQWALRNEHSRHVIFIDRFNTARLCTEVSFVGESSSGNQVQRPHYIVDSRSGEILDYYDNLQYSEASGPGGNEKTGRYDYGKEYPLLSVTQNGSVGYMMNDTVETINLKNGAFGFTHSFVMPTNTEQAVNGAYCPINDAHYFGSTVFNLFRSWYNTAPLTFKLKMRVHFGVNYENAFWDGQSMSFGDGKDRFYPLVCLDVVGHEVSHGFTEQNSALIYNRQSGGINESFSDMAGKACEYFARGQNPWTLGADIIKNGAGLRFFDNPELDKRSIGSAKKYNDEMNVHYSSGVFNKAFFLLATTNGWNTKTAFDVFVYANQHYWQPSSSYKEAAQGVLSAARDLGYASEAVINAFLAVDVDVASVDEPPAEPSRLSAKALGRSVVFLDWNAGQLIKTYTVYLSKDPTQGFEVYDQPAETFCTVSDLTPQTTYYFKVSATNATATSPADTIVSVTTLDAGDPPAMPQHFTSQWINETDILFSWNRPTGADSFRLYYSFTKEFGYAIYDKTVDTCIIVNDLSQNQTLYFKVSACNAFGESKLSPALVETGKACPDPVITFLSNTTSIPYGNRVTLFWNITDAVKIRASGAWNDTDAGTMQGVHTTSPLTKNSTFTLEAVNKNNVQVKKEITIIVSEPSPWKLYQLYVKGSIVLYNNSRYECLQSHVSLKFLKPSTARFLWKKLDE